MREQIVIHFVPVFFMRINMNHLWRERAIFFSSVFEIEMDRIFGMTIVGSDYYFVLKVSEISENEMFLYMEHESESENEIIVSEKEEIRELLKLSGGSKPESLSRRNVPNIIRIEDSIEIIRRDYLEGDESLDEVIFSTSNHLRVICGFCRCTSLSRIEIPSSVEVISESGFCGCTSLNEIIFSSDSHLKSISGFDRCTSLCRIEIRSSVEVIWDNGFSGCTSLNEIIFSSDSHLRILCGFGKCTSLCRIEIPSSVEMIGTFGFHNSSSLRVVIIGEGCRLRTNEGLQWLHPFLVYENESEDMKQSLRHIHLSLGGGKVLYDH
jgi:hypothetical protein